jgi:tRNA nucleotidyltransferase (CCA-adding enzyme)
LRDSGLLVQILPEYAVCIGFDQQNPHHHLTLDEHMFEAVMYTVQNSASVETRLAALLHDIGKPSTQSFGDDGIAHYYVHELRGGDIAQVILERLKCSNELLETVVKLVRQHMRPPKHASTKALRKFVNDLGSHWRDALELRRADILAHAPEPDFDTNDWLTRMVAQCTSFPAHLEEFDERALNISGDELMGRFGLTGKAIGDAKKAAARAVIEGDLENQREAILAWLEANRITA